MAHFLIRVVDHRPKDFDLDPLRKYLADRNLRTILEGWGDFFAILQTEESRERLFLGLAWRLYSEDRLQVVGLQPSEVPSGTIEGAEWLNAREPITEMIRAKDFIGAREAESL